MKPKLNIITLAVNDLEKSMAFYKDGLGLPTERLVKAADHIIFDNKINDSNLLREAIKNESWNKLLPSRKNNNCTGGRSHLSF